MGIKRNLDESGILDDSAKITEGEAALYDRQIRLWGMECQNRLREAKILVFGLNGVAAEVVKNLTLIGVKQITIIDDAKVTPTDLTAQFFLSADKIGKPRAESSASAIRELNPNVNINILSEDLFSKSGDFYREFHAIIASDCCMNILTKLDQLCQDEDIQFYCADAWGFYGYCFLDLQTHVYKNSVVVITDKSKGVKKEKHEYQKPVDATLKYCPLSSTFLTKVGKGLKKRVNKVFVLLHMLYDFHELFNRFPQPESHEHDVEELKKLRAVVCEKLLYNAEKISDEMLNSVFGQLSPVCAVLGGILANEIIKGVAKRGIPIYNYFFFDGYESVGANETIMA